jgi:hypothetical protein
MEKREAKSKWDELAREIGADISPEKEQLVESPPVAESAASEPPSQRAAARSTAPKRPAGWDNLASEFGLPTPEAVAEPVIDEVPAETKSVADDVSEVEMPRRERKSDERPPRERHDRTHQRRGGRSRDRGDARREPPRERGGRSRGGRRQDHSGDRSQRGHREERRPRRQRAERETRDKPVEGEGRESWEERGERERGDEREVRTDFERRELEDQRDEVRASVPPEVGEEPPKPAPAVSLWQKIFGSPAEPARVPSESAPHEEVERARTSAADEEDRIGDTSDMGARSIDERLSDAEVGGKPADVESTSDESDVSEARQRRPRRRRRGRGGRGDRRTDAQADETRRGGSTVHESVHEDDFDELIPADERFEADDRDELADGAELADEEGDSGSDRTASTRSRAALQRSIPSWDEAIGYIVDLNMQARSQRRQSSHTASRSGSGRGRPSRDRRKN